MSRIGKLAIAIPEKVTVECSKENVVSVKGPLGELSQQLTGNITLEIEEQTVKVIRPTDQKRHRALHGLYRSLIQNMVQGVVEGYSKSLELVGVGYRVEQKGNLLDFALGYSHHIFFEVPPEVNVEVVQEKKLNPRVVLKSADKQLLGAVAAKIRSFRKPEPYKGKGIRIQGEFIRRKAGKAGAK